ncbi:peptidyl-prolyl cis-trans isomerase FKBP53-like [Salvia splendens]|uniref:peptidyl-prolyl cis-trans isomerase FKBP53-like n=1 Tax=Salvia splendens TaxID=180675 RepID=UPI001C252492|nr:peptidyl-prolyl cis-trans isomerase FKBP53-like [Salvia splendens]
MAFWGIEVKPGTPYTLSDEERGRLHVTQATLGSGESTKKSILQCEVGDKDPIYLCSLLPDKLETCPLNLEFEEDKKVTFSIVGPQSVHLSGFFYGDESEDEDESDEDGYGCCYEEDDAMGIGSEDEEDFDYDSEDEEDEDCSEDDLCCRHPHSTVRNSGVKIEEIVDDEKPTNENGVSKQAKKKKKAAGNENSNSQIVTKTETSVPVLESEDEDGFPVPASDETKHESIGKKSQNRNEKADAGSERKLKRKSGEIDQNEQPARDTTENEVKQKNNKKKKVAQNSLQNGKPDSKVTVEPPVSEAGSDLKSSSEKKKEKKKNKKNKLQENAQTPSAEKKVAEKNETDVEKQEKGGASKSLQVRTYPNGLVTEEVAMGKPDGRRASPGKKVSVHYIGKLQKNGKIFDSNVRKAPFKFRLGIGQVIKGWDVGVNGMRVGDKRRLTIPPAMGYGAKGCPPAIPPNSWLVFDVELVDVN